MCPMNIIPSEELDRDTFVGLGLSMSTKILPDTLHGPHVEGLVWIIMYHRSTAGLFHIFSTYIVIGAGRVSDLVGLA